MKDKEILISQFKKSIKGFKSLIYMIRKDLNTLSRKLPQFEKNIYEIDEVTGNIIDNLYKFNIEHDINYIITDLEDFKSNIKEIKVQKGLEIRNEIIETLKKEKLEVKLIQDDILFNGFTIIFNFDKNQARFRYGRIEIDKLLIDFDKIIKKCKNLSDLYIKANFNSKSFLELLISAYNNCVLLENQSKTKESKMNIIEIFWQISFLSQKDKDLFNPSKNLYKDYNIIKFLVELNKLKKENYFTHNNLTLELFPATIDKSGDLHKVIYLPDNQGHESAYESLNFREST